MSHPHSKTLSLGAGFRYSPYGPAYNPGAEYWAKLGERVAGLFRNSHPEAIWIVSKLDGEGTQLSFPGRSDVPYIEFSSEDENEQTLSLFDLRNIHVWLQVEPGKANVETLFDLILARYGHHRCVIGVGVDVEWHYSSQRTEGTPVSDDEAAGWFAVVQAHNPRYLLFLKHWETSMLPPNLRNGLLFVDDSQMFANINDMCSEFADWGRNFSPAPVAFQIGYPADKKWWGDYKDPATTIGHAILNIVPNTAGMFWVDFTALEVFPP